ncbi:MAG: hypothetical protein Q7J98_03460 [Kiritimatiellia bacterium]|nr:hypothetical protein [Kiritimatiellia bacterium]
MSLLQDALKRKELDEAQSKPETGSAEKVPVALPTDAANLPAGQQEPDDKSAFIPPDAPLRAMPVPEHPQAAASPSILRKISSLWVIMAAIVILLVLTVVIGSVFFIYRSRPLLKAEIDRPDNHIGKTDTIAVADTNATIGQPIPSDKREPADSTATAVIQQVAAPVVKNVDDANIEPKPVSIKPTLVRVKTPKASSAAIKWPLLKLTGILRGSGPAESTAVINGKMINAGQTIDKVTVVAIQADGVLLKCGTEKKFLRVGATLY